MYQSWQLSVETRGLLVRSHIANMQWSLTKAVRIVPATFAGDASSAGRVGRLSITPAARRPLPGSNRAGRSM